MIKKQKIALRILALGMLSSGILASVAWFSPGTNSFSTQITGNIVEEYFHCGNGTEDNPFVITRPVHYYHMTEFFQRETVLPTSDGEKVFGTDYLYFQVGYPLKENDSSLYVYEYDNTGTYTGTSSNPRYSKTLNMSYFSNENALMPIGTNEIPFFGSFDGGADSTAANGITISNLNIKTSDTVYIDNTPINRTTSDVGVFGYVADQKDSSHKTVIANAYFDNLTIDLSGASSQGSSDAGHVSSHANDEVYVGYIVGHMHTYTKYSSIGPANSSPLHDVYVNNAKIEGGSGAKSCFGYVGYADTIDGTPGSDLNLSDIIGDLNDAAGSGQGDEGEWGGSINPRIYSRRIYDNYKGVNANGLETSDIKQNTDYTINSSPTNNFKLNFRMTTSRTYPRNASSYTYYSDPDYFNDPQDGKSVSNKIYSVLYHLRDNGYTPLRFNDEKTDTHVKNTGYIIGSNHNNAGSPKVSSGYISNIGNSISDTAIATTGNASNNYLTMTYDDSRLDVLTYSTKDDAWYTIKDSHNQNHTIANTTITNLGLSSRTVEQLEFEKYNDSRNSLQNILETAPRLNAIKFDNTVVSSSNLLNVTSGTIKINNQEYVTSSSSPYQFPKGSIDFNLKRTGYINFFAGTYYYSQTMYNFSFFTLNHIDRTGGTINSIKKISEIYQNKYWDVRQQSSSTLNPKFFYKYSDGSFSKIVANGVTRVATLADRDTTKGVDGLVFAASYALESPLGTSSISLFKKSVNNLVFYFEVPVNDGEYALGMAENPDPGTITSFTGAYLMYLDIGANGDKTQSDYNTDNKISNDPIFTQMEYLSSGYVINSCFNIAYVVPDSATKNNFYIKVTRNGTVFEVEICNTTSNSFSIDVLLVDNDNDPDNDYPYTYTLKYNSGSVSEGYSYSASFIGAANGSILIEQT